MAKAVRWFRISARHAQAVVLRQFDTHYPGRQPGPAPRSWWNWQTYQIQNLRPQGIEGSTPSERTTPCLTPSSLADKRNPHRARGENGRHTRLRIWRRKALGVRRPPSAPLFPADWRDLRRSGQFSFNGDVSSVGRALDCGSSGRRRSDGRFESGTSPHFSIARVAPRSRFPYLSGAIGSAAVSKTEG